MEERLIFVTVGTEHYPFDRLVGWVDRWLASRQDRDLRCVVQFGASAPPARAEGAAFFEYEHIEKLVGEADAVVTHGGTGGVMMARHVGRKPIVVPRLRARGEHVDDHQVVFARFMAARDDAVLVQTEADLAATLDAVVDRRLDLRIDPEAAGSGAAARFAELVDAMLAGRRT